MKDDHENSEMQPWNSPELEARVVAWVAGEASPFEIAELERLVAENPELAIFKRRIEAVQGLVAEAVRPEAEPLRLAPDRRAKLLASLGAPPPTAESLYSFQAKQKRQRRWSLMIAACFPILLLLGVLLRERSRETQLAAASKAGHELSAKREVKVPIFRESNPNYSDQNKPRAETEVIESETAIPTKPVGARDTDVVMMDKFVASDASATSLGATFSAAPETPRAIAVPSPREVLSNVGQSAYGFGAITTTAGGSIVPDAGKVIATAGKNSFYAAGARTTSSGGNVTLGTGTNHNAGTITLTPFAVNATSTQSYAEGSTVKLGAVSLTADAGAIAKEGLVGTGRIGGALNVAPISPPVTLAFVGTGTLGVSAAIDSVSTFSLHVSDVSFNLARQALNRGQLPDPAQIRPEEFYNAFDYGDPAPALSDKISCKIEQSADPFAQQRNLLRIAVKIPTGGRSSTQPLRLTILLDTSGSMQREDRVAILARAMKALESLLRPADRITLMGFSRVPRLLASDVPGDRAGELDRIIQQTPAEGGTNLEEALKLGGQQAIRHLVPLAQNRIVLLTDGAANLGNAQPAQLATLVKSFRERGVSFDACGIGLDGGADAVLEQLTRDGAGRYYLLNSPDAADAGFARELAGAFRPAATNVKMQVRFNPARVGNYRLIGFENHRLKTEDFHNDHIDGAELSDGQDAVALYQVQVLPQGTGELGEVYVRFRDTASAAMVERSWTLPFDPDAPAFARATPTLQLAGTAALLAEKLQGGPAAGQIDLRALAPVVTGLSAQFPNQTRVRQLETMFTQLRQHEAR